MLAAWESAESQGSAVPVGAGSSSQAAGFTDGTGLPMGAGQADKEHSTHLSMNDQLLLYFKYQKIKSFFPSTQLCQALPSQYSHI